MADLFDNPMGTDGFEFVEYTAPDPELLRTLFERMGFPVVARHRSKNVTLHRQGDVNFIINAEPGSFGQRFAQQHGPSACAMAFRVKDAAQAFKRAVELGATPVPNPVGPDGTEHPGDRGHRRQPDLPRRPLRRAHDLRRRLRAGRRRAAGARAGLTVIDHLTHNVHRGNMDQLGGLLRAAVQFPRDPLFRHRRQEDRAVQQGDDQPVRQDPHPDQRIAGRQVADRGIPARVPRRGHPAHRARDRGHLRHGRCAARQRHRVPGLARHLLRGRACARDAGTRRHSDELRKRGAS